MVSIRGNDVVDLRNVGVQVCRQRRGEGISLEVKTVAHREAVGLRVLAENRVRIGSVDIGDKRIRARSQGQVPLAPQAVSMLASCAAFKVSIPPAGQVESCEHGY